MKGYINPTGKLMRHPDRIAEWRKTGTTRSPIGVEIDISNRCNLGCSGCHFGYVHSRGPLSVVDFGMRAITDVGDLMSVSLFESIVNQLKDAGVRSLTLSGGGEPTIHPDFARLVGLAAEMPLGLYTNGTLIAGSKAELIKQSFQWVVISMDEVTAEDYHREKRADQFEDAKAGVKSLVEAEGGAKVALSFLVHAGNADKLNQMVDLGRELGAEYVEMRPKIMFDLDTPTHASEHVTWLGRVMPELVKLSRQDDVDVRLDSFEDYWHWQRGYETCYSVLFSGVITPNGKLWTCVNRRGFEGSECGDLTKETFEEIWARMKPVINFKDCRVSCRGHKLNKTLAQLSTPLLHEEFV